MYASKGFVWDELFCALELVINSSRNETIKLGLFDINIGRISTHPQTESKENCRIHYEPFQRDENSMKAFSKVARDNIAASQTNKKPYSYKNNKH